MYACTNGIYLKISEIDTKNHKFQNLRKINETYRYYPFYLHFLLLNFICIYYFSVYYSNSEYKYYRSEPWISCPLEPHILSCKEHSDTCWPKESVWNKSLYLKKKCKSICGGAYGNVWRKEGTGITKLCNIISKIKLSFKKSAFL